MPRSILAPLLTLAILTTLPAPHAEARADKREQAAAAKAELDRKFTPAFVRENIQTGTTTRAQVIALYGSYFQESLSSMGSTLIFDKSDIRDRTTSGIQRFARKFNAASGLAGMIPGVGNAQTMNAINRPANMADSAASKTQILREGEDGYGSMDRVVFDFDTGGIVREFQIF